MMSNFFQKMKADQLIRMLESELHLMAFHEELDSISRKEWMCEYQDPHILILSIVEDNWHIRAQFKRFPYGKKIRGLIISYQSPMREAPSCCWSFSSMSPNWMAKYINNNFLNRCLRELETINYAKCA